MTLIVCPVLCTLMKSFWQNRFGPVASQEDRVYVWILQRDMPIGSMYDHNWIEVGKLEHIHEWYGCDGCLWILYASNMKPSRWIQRCHASWFTCFTICGRNRFVEKKRAAAPVILARPIPSLWCSWEICLKRMVDMLYQIDGLCERVKDFGWSKDIRNY